MLKGKNYCISRENLGAHELFGLNASVFGSSDKKKVGLKGKVIDETKNLLVLQTGCNAKKLPKKECVFEFEIGDEKAIVQGKILVDRPEDRVKNFWRKRNAVQ